MTRAERQKNFLHSAFLAVAITALVLVALKMSGLLRLDANSGRVVTALLGAALALFYCFRGKSERLTLALLVACVFSVMNYYRFDSRAVTTVGNYYDTTYYYLNSKYFNELGYDDLYVGLLAADEDGPGKLRSVRTVRDMHTYESVSRQELMRGNRERVRANFTEPRWSAFKLDSGYFIERQSIDELKYLFKDHGYNPPPTWTLVGGTFSKLVSPAHLKWITMVDFLLIGAMFAALYWAFDSYVVLFSLLFFTSTAGGQWPVLGQALLRFDWLASITIAACALKKERHGLAGALLAYATASRIFPAIFFFPYLVFAGQRVLQEKKVPPPVLRFCGGACAVFALLIGGALLNTGAQSFVDSARTLALHGGAASYSSQRVGLGDALIYRGEQNWIHLKEHGGIPGRALELASLMPVLRVVGVLSLLLIGVYVFVRRPKMYAVLPLAYLPFFALTTPQINYHNIRLLLVACHVAEPKRARSAFGLTTLFLTEIGAVTASALGGIAYARTSLSSVGLTIYCAGISAFLVCELFPRLIPKRALSLTPEVRTLTIGAATALCVFCTQSGYFLAARRPAPEKTVPLSELGAKIPRGRSWKDKDVVRVTYSGLRVVLGASQVNQELELLTDGDDRYDILFYRDGSRVSSKLTRPSRGAHPGRLDRRLVRVPGSAIKAGYDELRLLPERGDDRFAIAGLKLKP